MNIEYHKMWSTNLQRNMELKTYGSSGTPILVFPCQGGRFFEFEDFGMLPIVEQFVDKGQFRFVTVDSIDLESWANTKVHPIERGHRHEEYDRYITQEVVPFIWSIAPGTDIMTYGCSMGGYHAGNFFFRHPDLFKGMISLSGLFSLEIFVGGYINDTVYFNSPLRYLPDLNDDVYLRRYRNSKIIICAGQGAFDEPMVADARAMDALLTAKGIPHWVDIWGHDVNHDWPWWRKQLPYFLGSLVDKA
jgi:esterase/lipase superfamily enzyme